MLPYHTLEEKTFKKCIVEILFEMVLFSFGFICIAFKFLIRTEKKLNFGSIKKLFFITKKIQSCHNNCHILRQIKKLTLIKIIYLNNQTVVVAKICGGASLLSSLSGFGSFKASS